MDDEITFTSESFHSFVSRELEHKKEEIMNLIINHLLEDIDNIESLSTLPTYLEETNRKKEILELLTLDNLQRLLNKSQSLGTLKNIARNGFNASVSSGNSEDILKFGIHNSIVEESFYTRIFKSEIKATWT